MMIKTLRNKIKRIYHFVVVKFFLKKQLNRQFNTKDFTSSIVKYKKRILVAMIETNHYQFLQIFSIAKALELRGAEIKILVCDESLTGCEIKSVKNEFDKDPCWECRFNKKNILPSFDFETISYSDLISKSEICEIEEVSNNLLRQEKIFFDNTNLTTYINDSVTRYYYGGDPDKIEDKDKIKLKHIRTAIINHIFAKKIDDTWSPDIMLSNMSVYSAWGPIYNQFKDRIAAIDKSDFDPKCITYNFIDVILSRNRFNQYVRERGNKKLNLNEKNEVSTFYNKRMLGTDWLFQKNKFFNNKLTIENIRSKLSIDKNKRNIFLFTNLYWDIGLNETGRLYDDIISWVLDTIRLVSSNDDVHLYIKTHPAEEFGTANSRKGVGTIIRENFPNGIKNMTIIEPNLTIKPYSLFPFIDIAILYQGTLGFELLNKNIPVISCGTAAYNGLGLVHEPKNIGEYADTIINGETIDFDRDLFELLSFFYFKKVLIPWDISNTSYGNTFLKPFNIDNINDLVSKKSKLGHICKIILDNASSSPEIWDS